MSDIAAERMQLDEQLIGVAASFFPYRNPDPDESFLGFERDRPAGFDIQAEKELGTAAATGAFSAECHL